MEQPGASAETFFSVSLSMLQVDSIVPCELYVRSAAGAPVLYRGKDTPFGELHRQKLLNAGFETVLIRFAEAGDWSRYTERGLRAQVNDHSRPIEERAQLLLDTARPLLKEVLDDPRRPDAEQRVTALADSICDLMRAPDAVAASVRMMEHDYYTYTHSLHVSIYSVALASSIGLTDRRTLASIGRGALMHDCGKCMLPPHLINKPGKLSGDEWEQMRQHPTHGVKVLRESFWTDSIVEEMASTHHERLDGSGYPSGLGSKQILDPARICAIADAYDAMTTDRSYQKALGGAEALKIIRFKGRETYDQKMVESFIKLLLEPAAV